MFLILAIILPTTHKITKLLLFLIPYFIIGYDILIDALHGIINLSPFDENFLMAAATVGAMILGEYTEGVAVMLFYQIGELFQSIAVGKSRKNISSLMDIRPDTANLVLSDGSINMVDPAEVEIESTIIVKPGERVPIDGVIVKGSTSLDTSALTGEAVPRNACEGDEIVSGVINLSSPVFIKTTKEFGESTASKILELVENASSRKSKSEHFITKFARVYTPVVCFSALALALIPPFLSVLSTGSWEFSKWVYRALTFLVISCPCALVISIPLGFFACIGGACSEGILIKGSNFIETLSKTKIAVFDKTGTLTKGVFEVTEIHPIGLSESELVEYAAYAESFSTHPIGESLKKAYGKEIDRGRISDISEISGMGISAVIDNKKVLVGKPLLLRESGVDFEKCENQSTAVYISIDGKYSGCIIISDIIKDGSDNAIKALKKTGITECIMLTGDSREVAQKVASTLGIDRFFSELLPNDKVEIVEKLISEKGAEQKLIFVGDGINDAPVLSRADVGISMGTIGSDAAIEASDIVLMDDNPEKIPKAINISKKCMTIVYQNIVFAIGIKILCLILGAAGIANMWVAIFADVGVMVIAVLNAIRTL
ncbi:MAG: cadmium-translocating P-type ATPase, partial [Clostridia bacterium]|nr:cadmium-translocating P-type ATPase [Clostridia bacterium]